MQNPLLAAFLFLQWFLIQFLFKNYAKSSPGCLHLAVVVSHSILTQNNNLYDNADKLYKDKNADGLSLLSLNIQGFGYILYSLHGYFNDDPPILWGMMPPFVQNCIIIGMVIYYNKYNSSRS